MRRKCERMRREMRKRKGKERKAKIEGSKTCWRRKKDEVAECSSFLERESLPSL